MQRDIAIAIAFIAAVVVAFSAGYAYKHQPAAGVENSAETAAPNPEPKPDPAPAPQSAPITRAQVDALRLGVTYDDVAQQWARESDQRESKYDDGTPGYTQASVTVSHIWDNPDGTQARLGFVDGKLAEKEFRERAAETKE